MTSSPHGALHRQRWREIGRNAGGAVTARLIATVGGLAQVPIALHHLGAEAYGFWITLTGIVTLLHISDLGLGLGLQNRMAEHFGRGELAAIPGLLRYGFRQLALTVLVAAPVGGIVIRQVDWAGLLNLTDPALIQSVRAALFTMLLGFCLNLPLNLANRLAAAIQRPSLVSLWNCASIVVQLGLILLAAWLGAGVEVFVGISVAALILQNIALLLHLRASHAWLRQPDAPPAPGDLRHLRFSSVQFFLQQACANFSTSFLPVAISIFSGPVMVTQFGLLQRIFGVVLQVQWMAASPLWPAYTEARARADDRWIRNSFRVSLVSMGALFVVLGLIALFHPWLFRLWLGSEAVTVAPAFLGWTLVWFAGLLVTHPFAMLLGGFGHAAGSAAYWVGTVALFLAGTWWLGPEWGALGVVGSAGVAMLAINLPGMVIEGCVRYRAALRDLAAAPAAPAVMSR